MTPQQVKTLKRLIVTVALLFVTTTWTLYVEFAAVAQGGESTISELAWLAWAHEPGALFGVGMLLTAAVAFLGGHFFWQSPTVYKAKREGNPLKSSEPQA